MNFPTEGTKNKEKDFVKGRATKHVFSSIATYYVSIGVSTTV